MRRAAGLLLAALLSCVGALLLSGYLAQPAHAAGGLVASEPDGNQQLDDAPGWVTLAFDGKVDKSVAKVVVTDSQGDNVTSGTLIVEDTNVTTQLEEGLDRGTYTVHYRVDGSGGEPRGGAFQFSYGRGSFSEQPDRSWSGTAQEPEILRGTDPNGPQQSELPPSEQDTPGVEVTKTEKGGDTQPTTRTTARDPGNNDPDQTDPDQTDTDEPTDTVTDPSASGTATATQSGTGRAFLIGGIVLLLAVGGAGFGLYRASKRGDHS